MKIKSFACAAALAALSATNTFATLPLGTGFTYQGRLNDGGVPANGNYDMIFNLYDAPTNGNVIGSFSIFGAVPVTNGLFTVELNSYGEFGPNAFNGQARWLQIGVRTNSVILPWADLSPRQPLDPTPQAIFAMNAMNAINAVNASNSLNASFAATVADGSITSSKLAPGAIAWSSIAGIPPGFADGVDNDTTYAAGTGLTLSGANNQFSVNFAGSGNANTAARSDHGHFAANWSGTSSGFGLVVANNSTSGSGIFGQQGTGSGVSMPFSYKAAIWGESSQGDAVYGATASPGGSGVYGHAAAASGANFGVYGQSDSPNGTGVLARGSGTTGTALRVSNGAVRVTGAGANTATPAFIHVASVANTDPYGFYTIVDNPYCNSDPNALLFVTPNSNGSADAPSISVAYDSIGYIATNHWLLQVTDYGNGYINPGAQFNILVVKP